jgi:cell division protein FtsL
MDPNIENQTPNQMNQPNVPAQPVKQGGKAPIIVIVIIVVIALIAIGLTWYLVSSSATRSAQQKDTQIAELNTKIEDLNKQIKDLKDSQTTTTPAASDQTVILNNIKALYKDRTGGGDTEAEKKYFTDAYYNTLSTGEFAADPILCAQNVVDYDKLVFNNPTISGTNATISVKNQYGTTINIKLVKQNNSWLVSSVTCPAT